jgi:hypothetical protein
VSVPARGRPGAPGSGPASASRPAVPVARMRAHRPPGSAAARAARSRTASRRVPIGGIRPAQGSGRTIPRGAWGG